ncbi:MAG: response regulator transcription factor [Flavobacterium sp.]
MKNNNITVAIVDDHPIVIEGLKQLLSGVKGMEICECFYNGDEILAYMNTRKIDVVLLDITLPTISGIDLCHAIKVAHPTTAILMLSNRSERSMIMQSLQNGASGYLLKNASLDELEKCINEVILGNIVFCKEIKAIISKPANKEEEGIPKLTKRENEILKLLASGKTTAMLAEELYLSPLTVETHRKNIMQKFKAKNVAELILLATQRGMI